MEMVDFLKRNILDSVARQGFNSESVEYLTKLKEEIKELDAFLERNANSIKRTIK